MASSNITVTIEGKYTIYFDNVWKVLPKCPTDSKLYRIIYKNNTYVDFLKDLTWDRFTSQLIGSTFSYIQLINSYINLTLLYSVSYRYNTKTINYEVVIVSEAETLVLSYPTKEQALITCKALQDAREAIYLSPANIVDKIEETTPAFVADRFFEFTQSTASSLWHIEHNLGRIPTVTIYDEQGDIVVADVSHLSNNVTLVEFLSPIKGVARLT